MHPPIMPRPPFRYEWHQDDCRQNCETDPRQQLSVKTVRPDQEMTPMLMM